MTIPREFHKPAFALRVLRAIRLDASLFAEIGHAPEASVQSACVVLVGGLARGVGAMSQEGWVGLAGGVGVGLALWLAAALAVRTITSLYLRSTTSFGDLLRTIGFAAAPLWLLVLRALPLGPLDPVVSWVAHGLATGALVLAVRQALDVDTRRAALVVCGALALGIATLTVLSLLFVGRSAG